MATNKVVLNSKGRYVQGGGTTRHPTRTGWWERKIFPRLDNDEFIEIPAIAHLRPDILAFDYFGKAGLGWLILQYNNIVDINEEFRAGQKIRMPNSSNALLSLNEKTGGIAPPA